MTQPLTDATEQSFERWMDGYSPDWRQYFGPGDIAPLHNAFLAGAASNRSETVNISTDSINKDGTLATFTLPTLPSAIPRTLPRFWSCKAKESSGTFYLNSGFGHTRYECSTCGAESADGKLECLYKSEPLPKNVRDFK